MSLSTGSFPALRADARVRTTVDIRQRSHCVIVSMSHLRRGRGPNACRRARGVRHPQRQSQPRTVTSRSYAREALAISHGTNAQLSTEIYEKRLTLVLGTLPFIPAPPGAPPDTPPDPGDPPGDPRPGGGGDDGPGPGADDGPGPGDPPGAGRGPDDAGGPGGPDDTGGPGGPGASGSAPGGSGGAGSHPADRGPGGRPGPVSGDPGDPGDRGRGGRGGPAGGPGGHRRPPGLAADDPPPRDRPPGRSSRPGRRPGARPARPDNTGPPGGP